MSNLNIKFSKYLYCFILFLAPLAASAATVGSYFDVTNNQKYDLDANGTTVHPTQDPIVAHYEDTVHVFDPRIVTHQISIYVAGTNNRICTVTEQAEIDWEFGPSVDWEKATSDTTACHVTPWISGQGDQTAHVSITV